MTLETKKVQNVEVRIGAGVFVDGEHFPYPVSRDAGFRVESLPNHIPNRPEHILWVPLIAEGPAPVAGAPDAEPWEPYTCMTDEERRLRDRWHEIEASRKGLQP